MSTRAKHDRVAVAIRHRPTDRRRRAAIALAAMLTLASATPGAAQTGQMAMAPAGGFVNRAAAGLRRLNENGPGVLYYGVNAADRGLGYRGSYMTLGGFIPAFEDDLGGFWAADLRGHLSTYGGFFSNVGAVRKQFLGGTLLGVGVYWDYDSDQGQYPDELIAGTDYAFPGGQTYNQVGVSGEWLTDWGNLRSNGYIPLGTTAQFVGPFLQNSILCVNGVNAALGGADLEVGAYVPGLADWAGMISVGGYALGNTRYAFPDGQAVAPWFGGVYTRLDMTFIENWDFSLQANNDSYFDWTGFARLSYRMGGSRRRNVPDQVEQPMMRNEHVVRARQSPKVAINPATGQPWNIYHVDSSAAPGGDGTAEAPFTTLGQGSGAATQPYDIVFVAVGRSGVNPYFTPVDGYTFAADNQYLIGAGSSLTIPTVDCGPYTLRDTGDPSLYPRISNPLGTAIVVDRPGTVVSHVRIEASPLGISDGAGIPAPGQALISDVIIAGNGGAFQRGVQIANSTGQFTFDQVQMMDLQEGFRVSADNARVVIRDARLTDIAGTALLLSGTDGRATVTGSTFEDVDVAVNASGANAEVRIADSTIRRTTGDALVASGAGAEIDANRVQILSAGGAGMVASGTGAQVTGNTVEIRGAGGDGVQVSGTGALASLEAAVISDAGGNGALVSGEGAKFFLTGESLLRNAASDGVRVEGRNATVLVQDSRIIDAGENGVTVLDDTGTSTTTQVTILRSTINNSGSYGVYAQNIDGSEQVVQIFGTAISGADLAGVVAEASNVDIGRDPTRRGGRTTSINNTGVFGVSVVGGSTVRVEETTISGATLGIDATTVLGNLNLRALNNTISATEGPGISLTADATSAPLSLARGWLLSNDITSGGDTDIALTTLNPPDAPAADPKVIWITDAVSAVALGAINGGATVTETPQPDATTDPQQPSLVRWSAPQPPAPPNPAVPTPP